MCRERLQHCKIRCSKESFRSSDHCRSTSGFAGVCADHLPPAPPSTGIQRGQVRQRDQDSDEHPPLMLSAVLEAKQLVNPREHLGTPSVGWWWAMFAHAGPRGGQLGCGAVTEAPPGAELCTCLHDGLECSLLLGRDIKPLHLLGLQIPACKMHPRGSSVLLCSKSSRGQWGWGPSSTNVARLCWGVPLPHGIGN